MTGVGIIGFGYWGPNLLRNFMRVKDCNVVGVADASPQRQDAVRSMHPSLKLWNNLDEMLAEPSVDAVVIATPVNSHVTLALKALESGRHVFVEKPLTSSEADATRLVDLAEKKSKVLMVDHTFLYNGAVMKMKELIDSGSIGDFQYFDSVRINLGLFQHDVNVIWDLAPHDISILLYLYSKRPSSVVAVGSSHTQSNIENIAYANLFYPDNVIAHLTCSWVSPVKIRQTLIGGTKKMLAWNDLEVSEKLKIYDSGYDIQNDEEKRRLLVDYRVGDIHIPSLDREEPLLSVAKDFINSIAKNKKPRSDGHFGAEVVRILEAMNKSMRQRGKEVTL